MKSGRDGAGIRGFRGSGSRWLNGLCRCLHSGCTDSDGTGPTRLDPLSNHDNLTWGVEVGSASTDEPGRVPIRAALNEDAFPKKALAAMEGQIVSPNVHPPCPLWANLSNCGSRGSYCACTTTTSLVPWRGKLIEQAAEARRQPHSALATNLTLRLTNLRRVAS